MKIRIVLQDGRVMRATLDEKAAPLTVAHIGKLVDENFFRGLIFHRVIPGFVIQGGGLDADMQPKKCESVKGEFRSNGVNNPLRHTKGALSMARTMFPNSATSQFFVCVDDVPHLDGEYAAFGYLDDAESIDVAVAIASVPTRSVGMYDDVPATPVVIDRIERVE